MYMHELYLRHGAAMGVDSYGTFCKVVELLDAPARLEYNVGRGWKQHAAITAVAWLVYAAYKTKSTGRITLLDGTVIREWSSQ